MSRRKQSISGAWSGHLVEMMNSTAWRVLSLSARLILDRLEIEHRSHGGCENGRLIVTHSQFADFGIHHNSIGPALRELEALGFLESQSMVRPGLAGTGDRTDFG
jgi:hypothetical protein